MNMRATLDENTLRKLRERNRGEVVVPGDAGYDQARRIWNGRFDRHPAAIVYCTRPDDVIAAVDSARTNGLRVCIRSGGHDYAGASVADGALVIDMSRMNRIAVDTASRTARVGPGARWGGVDGETQAHGLVTTGGTVSTVGISGYTLGGGTGHLVRKHGLALDNLVSADLVTARGELLRASEQEHSDLFWGLRGGRGSFGIVTSLELALHELRSPVFAGQIMHPLEAAVDVLRFYRDFMASAPDEIQCYAFFIRLPSIPALPPAFHGKVVLDLVVSHTGDPDRAESALAPLRSVGSPFLDSVAPMPYTALQQAFDAGMQPGNRWYSKAHYLRELSDEVIATLLTEVEHLPGELTMVYLEPQGGAIARVPAEATAFPHREAPFSIHIFSGWTDPRDDSRIMAWTRSFHEALSPNSTGGVYVNLLGGDEPDGLRSAYGVNYERLVTLKRTHDPHDLFGPIGHPA